MTVTLQHPRYHFDRWIAAGGMGEVWQATDTLLDREVAVKVLRRELAEDPVFRARFAAEARHAGALQHPHVASVLDYGEIVDQGPTPIPFLVMELVEGQSLSMLLSREGALAPQVAADLIAQAAEGIEAAHAIGIVHRDVKPGNLLVTPHGQVKVTDFGVARAADTASLTMTGHLVGTPHYLSPEQAEGGSATAVSDVYSLGIVLFECLTGRKPFAGESPVATAVMHIREPLPDFPGSVPERLQTITRVATTKDPSHRFRSAGAMAAALRDESADTRSLLVPASTPLASVPIDQSPEPPRRRARATRLLAVLLVLLLLSFGAWAMTSSTDEPIGTPAAEASDAADPVPVREGRFLGRDVADAFRILAEKGLRPRIVRERRANPGKEVGGTVAAIDPTGLVDVGSRVRLTLWAAAPAPTPAAPPSEGGSTGPDAGGPGPSDGGSSDPGPSSGGSSDGGPSSGGSSGGTAGQGPNAGSGQGPAGSNGQGPGSNNAGGNGKGKGNGGGNGKPGKGGKR